MNDDAVAVLQLNSLSLTRWIRQHYSKGHCIEIGLTVGGEGVVKNGLAVTMTVPHKG